MLSISQVEGDASSPGLLLMLPILLIAISLTLLVIIYFLRSKKVPPGKAMVVYGHRMRSDRGYVVIVKGGRFVYPVIEDVMYMDLGPTRVELKVRDVMRRKGGGWANISGTVRYQYGINTEEAPLDTAAEHLLGLEPKEISRMVEGFIEAGLKSMLACVDIPESLEDRERLVAAFQSMVNQDLANIGIKMDGFDIDGLRFTEGGMGPW